MCCLQVHSISSRLDAEMKDATREGLHVKNKKEEKESVTEEEEELFWNLNLLGMSTAKSLLNTVQ